ncbi:MULTISPECIES: winged helix-turn-helix domain-containing protein [unclassified Alteromonas]|uniref:winged helix-turn-helix domain-containing protein n=1 Tax=unclassified Alteromonas TaxID=2614992 RepID=UPI0009DED786|nr:MULTISPECIES: helix-turn-helix domain-containing protein [unclassified Alteromonas]
MKTVAKTLMYESETRRLVRSDGQYVSLSPACSRLLTSLIEAESKGVPRDELRSIVWGHRYVSDDAINHLVCRLRRKISALCETQEWEIETLPCQGYRLLIKTPPPVGFLSKVINQLNTLWQSRP